MRTGLRVLLAISIGLGLLGAGHYFMRQRQQSLLRRSPAPSTPSVVSDDLPGYRKIHLFVALCDNKNQGIVPVPAGIGNGQEAKSNLYWGARYGVKTFFNRSAEWTLVREEPTPRTPILERLIYRHKSTKTYLLADAYDGAHIAETMTDMLRAAAGEQPEALSIDDHRFLFGGGADLIAYIGHNGLMDASLELTLQPRDTKRRDAIVLCCMSRDYFTPYLQQAGATPLLTTTNFMCPEAYTLHAALAGWINGETGTQIHERAARTYHQYQHCGLPGARRLFHTSE